MKKTLAGALAVLLLTAACGGGTGAGPSGGTVKLSDGKLVIAVINDQSGVYADLSGKNAVEAVKMAVEDFKAKYGENALGGSVEVLTADHQNKADVAQQKAQEFYERNNADLILDVPTSSAALAIADVAKTEKKRTTYGTAMGQMCELALAWLDRAGLFRTTPDERRVELNWPSPLPEDAMTRLQEAEAKVRLGVPKEVVLRELGY